MGIRNCFSIMDLRSEIFVAFGFSSFTLSRPSRLRIRSIMVVVVVWVLVVLCDDELMIVEKMERDFYVGME